MATTREKIDSRGRSLLQLLIDKEGSMSNLMNPSSRDQNTYDGPNPDKPVDILWPKNASEIGTPVDISVQYFLREFKRHLEKERSARKRGPYIAMGTANMRTM